VNLVPNPKEGNTNSPEVIVIIKIFAFSPPFVVRYLVFHFFAVTLLEATQFGCFRNTDHT